MDPKRPEDAASAPPQPPAGPSAGSTEDPSARQVRRGCFIGMCLITVSLVVATIWLGTYTWNFRERLKEDPYSVAVEMVESNPQFEIIDGDPGAGGKGMLTLRDTESGALQRVDVEALVARRRDAIVAFENFPPLPDGLEPDPREPLTADRAGYRSRLAVADVLTAFAEVWRDAGYDVRTVGNLGAAGMLTADDVEGERLLSVTVGSDGSWTRVVVQASPGAPSEPQAADPASGDVANDDSD